MKYLLGVLAVILFAFVDIIFTILVIINSHLGQIVGSNMLGPIINYNIWEALLLLLLLVSPIPLIASFGIIIFKHIDSKKTLDPKENKQKKA